MKREKSYLVRQGLFSPRYGTYLFENTGFRPVLKEPHPCMIHVEPQPEPEIFAAEVRKRGLLFLSKNPKPSARTWKGHDYWRAILPDIHRAYREVCAYCCHWIPFDTGGRTIEHFLPKSKYPERAYDWSNYRLVCQLLNGRKGEKEDVLDPFMVEDGWFALDFDSLQVEPSAALCLPLRSRVRATIEQLRLNDQGTCRQMRETWFDEYCEGHISFGFLQRRAPFIAKELERQGRIGEVRARWRRRNELVTSGDDRSG